MYRRLAATLAACACASSLCAQDVAPVAAAALTLDEALAQAGAASPALDAARSGVDAARAQRVVAGLRPNPSIDAMVENLGGSGAYRGVRSVETTLGLSLPLETGGKRAARVAVADAQFGRATLATAIAQADLRQRVTQAFTLASAAGRRAAIAREQVGIAAGVLRAARIRVTAGRASPLEEQRAEVARLNAEGTAERAERSARLASENLARLIGHPVAGLDPSWFERVVEPEADDPIAAEATLAAAAARADLDSATAQVRLARSRRIPDVTLGAAARRLEATDDLAGVVSLSVPLPLFDTGRAAVDMAAAQRSQSDANRRLALLDVEQMIATARAEAANAASAARTATGPTLAAAREAARIARIGYREGKFGQLDLLEAERTLSETRSGAIDALAAYHDAQARLERLATPASDDPKDAR